MGSIMAEQVGSLQPRPPRNNNNYYGTARPYASLGSSYRAPATYSQPRQPQGGKGGYEAPPMRQQQNFGGMPTTAVSGYDASQHTNNFMDQSIQSSYGGGGPRVPASSSYGGGGPRVPMDNPYSSRPKGNYVTNRGGMSYTDMDSGIEYASPSFAPRNYASTMDMPSVADTPENRAAGQQYNTQLSQRFSSKGGVSPYPQPQVNVGFGSLRDSQPQNDPEQATLAVMPKPESSSQLGNLYKPNKSGAGAATSKVPSFDPKNPQEDAIKDPKLRKAAKQLNKQAPPGERLAFINPKEEELLKAVGGSGITAAGGVPSYKKGDVEAPPPRDYKQETRDTLEAQIELGRLWRSSSTRTGSTTRPC